MYDVRGTRYDFGCLPDGGLEDDGEAMRIAEAPFHEYTPSTEIRVKCSHALLLMGNSVNLEKLI